MIRAKEILRPITASPYTLGFTYFLIVLLVKGGFFHFHYYPFLDDWHLLGEPNLYPTHLSYIIQQQTYVIRPAFAIISALLVAPMWSHLGIWLFVICGLHAFNGLLFSHLIGLKRRSILIPFLLLFGLFPLPYEGEYWLSASLSTVLGVFFLLFSVALMRHAEKVAVLGKVIMYVFSFFTLLLAFGSYEQVISFGLMFFVVILLTWRKEGRNILTPSLITLCAFLLITAYYVYFEHHSTTLSSRIGSISSFGQLIQNAGNVVAIIFNLWVGKPDADLFYNGLPRGLQDVAFYHSFKYAVVIVILGLATVSLIFTRREAFNDSDGKLIRQYLCIGIILFVAAYGPFFASQENWISDRSTYVPLLGIALGVSSIIGILFDTVPLGRIFEAVVLFLYICVCSAVGISETVDYMVSAQFDQRTVNQITQVAKRMMTSNIVLVNSSYSFFPQNSLYHEHIQSSLSVQWAANSIAAVESRQMRNCNIVPLISGVPTPRVNLAHVVILGVSNGVVISLRENANANSINLLTPRGKLFGKLVLRRDSITFEST